ncbi:UNVERIFIED_CONTAM: recombinase family protein, partial [Salmonella enterica subsp. enterica serovar Enteritidis]
ARAFASALLDHLDEGWEGQSFSEIARRLNDKGIKTRTGRRFYPQTIKNYIGFWTTLPAASGGTAFL